MAFAAVIDIADAQSNTNEIDGYCLLECLNIVQSYRTHEEYVIFQKKTVQTGIQKPQNNYQL